MTHPRRQSTKTALPLLVLLFAAGTCAQQLLAGVTVEAMNGITVQLDPWADNSIRVRIAPPGGSIVDPAFRGLLPNPPKLTTRTFASDKGNALTNGNLHVAVDSDTGLITATRVSDGAILLNQTVMRFSKPFVYTTVKGSVASSVEFAGHPGERIYGLGEHRTGKVNQMNFTQQFADSQLYSKSSGADALIPWYASSLGYGFLWNLPSYGNVSITEQGISWYSQASLNADFWITTTSGSDSSRVSPYPDLLKSYVDAVGHAPTMPFYATGFIQCKNRYRNQTQLIDVARGYVERQLPISVIVIDYHHWINQGDWSFNPACWPDPQAMVDELKEMGIELMVTFWPFQTTPSQHWNEFSSKGYLATNLTGTQVPFDGNQQYVYDPFSTDAQNATFTGFMEGYGRYGIKTIWLDAAEPERFDENGVGKFLFSKGTDAEIGGAWVQQHVDMVAKGMKSIGIAPEEYFVLPRHAWTGSWRHSAGLWSGDIESSFDELSLQVRALQGVVMSGQALWTTDIGGYKNGDPSDPTFQELIVRWFQFGAFCPLFRLHGSRKGGPPSNECGATNGDNEVWNLAKDQDHYDAIVTVMRLREQLRNYVSQINNETAQTGMPMVRPMFLQFPLDDNCTKADVEDQFMFGPDWLVAPVMEMSAKSRSVYLPMIPNNETWVYYYNDSALPHRGVRVTVATPITEFPLFYRRPIPQPSTAPGDNMYNAERNDTLLCVSPDCHNANEPGSNYTTRWVEGYPFLTADPVTIGDATYQTIPLNLFFSYKWDDNYVSNATSPPDSSYTVKIQNGYVLSEQAPGSIQLQVWFKEDIHDHANVASQQGLDYVKSHNYTFVENAGYILAKAPAP